MSALRPVQPGSPLRIPADAYNAFVETALAHRQGQLAVEGETLAGRRDATVVSVRNDTGIDLPRFAVVELDSVLITPTDNLGEFHRRPLFKASKPTWRQTVHPAITTEPIAAGAIGHTCIEGPCSVQLDLPDSNRWRHATVRSIDTSKLYAADGGAVSILWHETGPGTKWAVAQLSGSMVSLLPQRRIRIQNQTGETLSIGQCVVLAQSFGGVSFGGIVADSLAQGIGFAYKPVALTSMFAMPAIVCSASIPAGGHGEVVIEGFVRVPQSYSGTRFRPTPNALALTSDLSGSILIASSITGATFLYLPPWQPPSLLLARIATGGIYTLGTSADPSPGAQPTNSLYLTPAGSAPFILNTVVTGSNVTLSGPPDWSMCLIHWDGQTCRVVAAKMTYAVG